MNTGTEPQPLNTTLEPTEPRIDRWVDRIRRDQELKHQIPWELMRNRPLTLREKAVVREFYSSYFQSGWDYNTRHPWHAVIAQFRHAVTSTVFKDLGKVLDAGCASGEIVSAFRDRGADCWGFDICPDLYDVVYPEARDYVRMGLLDAIPFSAEDGFKTCVSYDVFEHVPIDSLEKFPAELVRLGITQIGCIISNDTIGDGHITIQNLDYYEKLFADYGFRIMHEYTEYLREVPTPAGWDPNNQSVIWAPYERTGNPRNGWNAVPGHVFFERR